MHSEVGEPAICIMRISTVSPGHIEMDPTKLDGIWNWPTMTKVKDVHSFLRFANFYRKFIGDYSNITWPLLDLTKKDTPWNWNNSCQNTFNRLKNCFLTKPVLHLHDTSKYMSGGVLLQADSKRYEVGQGEMIRQNKLSVKSGGETSSCIQ